MNVGVEVTTGLRTGPTNAGPPSGIFQIAGITETGPVGQSVRVKSFGQYSTLFGGRTPYSSAMLDTARLFFEEGGADLIVSRAVGPGANAGSIVLQDSEGEDTLRVEAMYAGGYSAEYRVEVTANSGRVTLSVTKDGEQLAVFRDKDSINALITAAAGNRYVRLVDLGSGELPAASNGALTEGTDDRGNVTMTELVAAMETAGEDIAGGAVAAPGYPADVAGSALLDYATRANAIALLSPAEGASEAEAIQAADALAGSGSAAYAGLFYPHMVIPDASGTRVVSPEGYVAAVRARAFNQYGFWAAPAGERATTLWANGTVTVVDPAMNNRLSDALVNGIATVNGRTRLYNWVSLSTDRENFALLSARDTLNNLVVQIKRVLEPYVFNTVDGRGHLLSEIEGAAVGVLDPIATAGGFFARTNGDDVIDPGYRVVVDQTNNDVASLEQNQVLVDVAVRLSPVAALIKAEIVKVPLAAAL